MLASNTVLCEDDGAFDSAAPKTRPGRGKAWLSEENIGVALAACALPDAAIDGANMRSERYELKVYEQFIRHAPTLDELPDQSKLWRGRSPRSCVDQWKKIIRDCTKLHGRLTQVQRTNPTGNPSEGDLMRLALGFFNKTVMPSQAYEVLTNKAYDVGRAFAYANCYDVLKERYPARLEPSSLGTTTAGIERGGQHIQFDVQQDTGEGSGGGIARSAASDAERETPCNLNGSGPAGAPRSRPQGSKAAKRLRRGQYGGETMNEDIGSVSAALSSYTAVYKSASDRSMTQNEENYQAKKLRAGAASLRAGLDAYKVLFSEGAGASAADRDTYCELLRQQAIKQAQSAIQVPAAARR
jgi:hypothetical protein